MDAVHVIAGACGRARLVIDDEDRRALLDCAQQAHGGALLGYCVMDTHLHLVVEGAPAVARAGAAAALHRYAYGFNRWHGFAGARLRGPIEAIVIPGAFELARTLRYVHENPTGTRPPVVARAVEFAWSSQRDYAGLRRAGFANVARARGLLGRLLPRVAGPPLPRPDLSASPVPTASPELLVAAAAATFGVAPEEVGGPRRGLALDAARRLYVRLGELESYAHGQLAPALGRSRSRVSQIGGEPVPEDDVRIARTLLRDPGLRRGLLPPDAAGDPRQANRFGEPEGEMRGCPRQANRFG